MTARISTMALGVLLAVAIGSVSTQASAAKPTDEKDKKIVVKVESGDTLTKIADKHDTTYVRLFNANKKIESPDLINVGDKVRVPGEDEKLPNRYDTFRKSLAAIAAPTAPVATNAPSTATAQPKETVNAPAPQTASTYRGSSAGNTYASGYCTWYVKERRGDLPNMLGNGGAWVSNAAAQGIATGSSPRAGAVAEQPGHVAYVESVNGDGTVNVSEMNYRGSPGGGFGKVSYRTAPASSFTYIY